ncbi:ParA family protein [Magnetospirillum sp. SS-4]|uniref:ParA family protein n=1 Tax=Magnetospirillum sp. SS-4 TaxID=2681465 RepID=UPI0013822661|nr:ParA family protein [Magnetospirillum sp. SS-4]CAA7618785.1 Chromosome partitioning ATPase [Magnetospirillum sp. SS-4]
MPPPPTPRPPVMVAVFNQKGGVAKTTTSCNLAVCLRAFGYHVLLVDLDTQGNATGSFGFTPLPATGSFEVITGRAKAADIALDTPYPGLWLLPATTSLRDDTHMLAHAGRRRGLLEARLADTGVDVVIVDCPPALAAATATALASASVVLLPVRPDPFAHEGLVNTWYEIKRFRETINGRLGVAGILMTMSGSEPAGDDVARVIRAEFGDHVYATEIATDPKVAEAAGMALPVAVLDPDGPAGRAYVDATRELLFRLARHERPDLLLPEPLAVETALNQLREWRATTHAALLRVPGRGDGWAGTGADGHEDADTVPDDYFGPVPATDPSPPPPRPGLGRMAAALLAGLLAGMAIEAGTGILSGILGRSAGDAAVRYTGPNPP